MPQNEHTQYGNNFYLVFEGLRSGNDASVFSQRALQKAERYGEKWQLFLEENQELIARTFTALAVVEEYSSLLKRYNQLNKEKKWDEADIFEKEFDMNQFGINAWNHLNECLEEIGAVLANFEIDEKKLWM